MLERWRGNDRLVDKSEKPFTLLQQWGGRASEISFMLYRQASYINVSNFILNMLNLLLKSNIIILCKQSVVFHLSNFSFIKSNIILMLQGICAILKKNKHTIKKHRLGKVFRYSQYTIPGKKYIMCFGICTYFNF